MLPTVLGTGKIQEVRGKGKAAARGFFQFIQDYGVAPLAIGVVIANSVNDLVKTLVDGLFTPLITLILPGGKLQNFSIDINGATFKIGAIANSLLSFLAVVFLVYFLIKFILRKENLLKK